MDVVGGIGVIITVIDSVATLAKRLNEVKEKYENVPLYISWACGRLSVMRAALEAIKSGGLARLIPATFPDNFIKTLKSLSNVVQF